MKEEILSFDKLTDEQKEIAIENYKNARLTDDDEDYVKEYEQYTDEDWLESARCYSYFVNYFDNEEYSVRCLF